MLPTPLLVAVAWLVLWALLDGLGRLTARLLGAGPVFERPLARFWLGFASLLALLLSWHLVAPINGVTWLPAVALSLAGHALTRTHARLAPALARLAARPVFVTLAAALVAWTALAATAAPSHPDDYLYFLQTVTISGEFPAVPGIGQLHHRLAFNHAHHLYVAFCDVGPFEGGGFHLANGLPFLSVALATTDALLRTARIHLPARAGGPSILPALPIDPPTLAAALLFPIVVRHAHGHLASATADEVVFAFGTALALLALESLQPRESAGSGLQAVAGPFWWLAAGAVVAKPSLVLAAAPVLVAVLWNQRAALLATPLAAVRAPLASTLLLVAPWVAHGVVLSGYPLFPSTLLPFDVDWRLPHAIVAGEFEYVQAWGRKSMGVAPSDPRWLWHWVSRAWLFNLELVAPALVSLGALGRLATHRARDPETPSPLVPLALAASLTLVAWLFVTPDPRHAGITPWMLAAALFSLVIQRAGRPPSDALRATVAGLALAAALLDAPPFAAPGWRRTLTPADAPPTTPYEAGPGTTLQLGGVGGCVTPDCTETRVKAQYRVPGDFAHGFKAAE